MSTCLSVSHIVPCVTVLSVHSTHKSQYLTHKKRGDTDTITEIHSYVHIQIHSLYLCHTVTEALPTTSKISPHYT